MQLRYRWRAHRARYRDERAELLSAKAYCRADSIAVDIGAHKGSYTYWLAKWYAKVVAFEPQPELAIYLRNVVAPNVTVEAKGVFSSDGSLDLCAPPHAPAEASFVKSMADGKKITVPVVALDNYLGDMRQDVSFLKIDVEGSELEVFKGAERLLKETAPTLLFECETRHLDHSIESVFSFLRAANYDGFFFCRDKLTPLREFDPAVHQRRTPGDYWNKPNYCNNFLFLNPLSRSLNR